MSNKPTDNPEKDPNRALRMVVISMGLVLVGGMILLLVMIFFKMRQEDDTAAPAISKRTIFTPREYRGCGEHQAAIPHDQQVDQISYDGPVARILTRESSGKAHIHLIHACSGKPLGSIALNE